MPVQYRTFYMRKLINSKEKEKDQHEAASRKHEATPSKISRGPAIKK